MSAEERGSILSPVFRRSFNMLLRDGRFLFRFCLFILAGISSSTDEMY